MSYREETLTVRDRPIRCGLAPASRLYLHDTFHYTWTRVHDALAAHYEVLFPVHPGCAGSADLDDIDGMDDLVFHYLDVCATLGLERPVLVGPSLGGWLAVSGRCATRRCCALLSWWTRLACASLKPLPRISCASMPSRCGRCCSRIPMLQWPRTSSPMCQLRSPSKRASGAPDAGAFCLAVPG